MNEIDINVLKRIGLTPYITQQLLILKTNTESGVPARITEIQRDCIMLKSARGTTNIHRPATMEDLAVGDWVIIESTPTGDCRITSRMEPVTRIARRTSEGAHQLLVTNVDTALLVMGLDQDFNLRRIERYLAIVQAAQVSPVIVLTKQDVAVDVAQKLNAIKERLPDHLPIFSVNAHDSSVATALAPWLGLGQTLVLLGSSGAGKSTLTNTLTQTTARKTSEVRKSDSKGRHTTTARSLFSCVSGACIIDTPGLRTWSPDINEESLSNVFDDIDTLAASCRFRDCRHQDEPGCAVRDAIDPDRLLNYQKLLREVRRNQQTPLDRIHERNKWKALQKSAATHARNKRNSD
jgi:ribosome biogenesis GTPase